MNEDAKQSVSLAERGFTYSWQFFALHAGHRMQAVNFFLLAATFLVAAYVAAMANRHPAIAAGVALVGAATCFVFYRIERRIRDLLKAAEAALRPMEDAMAASTQNPNLRILDSVEGHRSGAWHYSKVFRVLYLMVGIAFLSAGLYAAWLQNASTPQTTALFPIVLQLAAGVLLLIFAYETWSIQPKLVGNDKPRRSVQANEVVQIIVGLLASLGGVATILCVVLRISRI